MAPRNPQALLERAFALPDAQSTDFLEDRRPPADIAPNLLKVINDTMLRSRLIGAGLAQGLQSPKGPQKVASIIRLYPEFDAPSTPKVPGFGRRLARGGRKGVRSLPTFEEMEALITRIRAVEGHVARELSMSIDGEIEQAQKRIAGAVGAAMETAFRELGTLLEKRRDGRRHVRETAFAQVERDKEFGPRVYVRLLSQEIEEI
jgi:hypothetical protein